MEGLGGTENPDFTHIVPVIARGRDAHDAGDHPDLVEHVAVGSANALSCERSHPDSDYERRLDRGTRSEGADDLLSDLKHRDGHDQRAGRRDGGTHRVIPLAFGLAHVGSVPARLGASSASIEGPERSRDCSQGGAVPIARRHRS